MAAWFGARFIQQFWSALFHPPLVLLEILVSYLLVPELTRQYDAIVASLLGLGAWLLLGSIWAAVRAVRGRLMSFDEAVQQLKPFQTAVNVDVGDNAPSVVQFTNELIELLNSANWVARHTGTWIAVDPRPEGIEISHPRDEAPEPYLKLRNVLCAMGYRATTSILEVERDGGIVEQGEREPTLATIVVGIGF